MNEDERFSYEEMLEVYLDKKDRVDEMGKMLAGLVMEGLQEQYMDRLIDEHPEWLL